ncbi:hypothetical protein GCM10020331_100290 [Ectobacillus funiculus]
MKQKYPGTIKDIKLSETDGNQIYIVDLQDQHRAYALKSRCLFRDDFYI